MHYARTAYLFCAIVFALGVLAGCAPQRHTPPPPVPRISEGVWMLQHKLQLDIPQRTFSQTFTGMMRLDLATRTAQAAAVSGMGMQLFAMRITPDTVHVDYMHPGLRKIPRVEAYIASCIRLVWFDYLPQIRLTDPARYGDVTLHSSGKRIADLWPERLVYEDTRIPFTLSVRLLQARQEQAQ